MSKNSGGGFFQKVDPMARTVRRVTVAESERETSASKIMQQIAQLDKDMEMLHRKVEVLNLQFEILNESRAEIRRNNKRIIIEDLSKVKQRLFGLRLLQLHSEFFEGLVNAWKLKNHVMEDGKRVELTSEKQAELRKDFNVELETEKQSYPSLMFESEDELCLLISKLVQSRDQLNTDLLSMLDSKNKTTEHLYQRDARLGQIEKRLKKLLDLYNTFMEACEYGDFERVTKLLQSEKYQKSKNLKKLLDLKGENKNTALHLACLGSHVEIVRKLIVAGADVNAQNEYGYRPIHLAIKGRGKLSDQENPEVIENKKKIIMLFMGTKIAIDAPGEYGRTALHIAAHDGYLELVLALIVLGAGVDVRSTTDRTALLDATWNGHVAVTKALLDNKAQFDAEINYTAKGDKPIMEAITSNNGEIFKLYFDKYATLDEQAGNSLETYARMQRWAKLCVVDDCDYYQIKCYDSDKVLACILTEFPKIAGHKFQFGDELIHLAVKSGAKRCLELLLTGDYRINPNAQGDGGRTALQVAVFQGDNGLVGLLVKNKADVNALARDGGTILQSALRSHHFDSSILSLLLMYGADFTQKNPCDEDLFTEALVQKNQKAVDCLDEYLEFFVKFNNFEKYTQLKTDWDCARQRQNQTESALRVS
ncbi:MAG: ankyrin repeat domain-containing protein [Gammaproteobacteria bacterium]|nr:ankyrin repeat domain-containing protein [Gammaproteobacteria bacterium]